MLIPSSVKSQKEFGFDIAIHHPDNYSQGHANSLRYEFHNVPHYHVHNVPARPNVPAPPTKSNVLVHHQPHLDRFRHVHGVVTHHHQPHKHQHGTLVHHTDRFVHPAPVVHHHVAPVHSPAPHAHLAHQHAIPCPHPEHLVHHHTTPPLLHSHRLVRPFSRAVPFRLRYPSRFPPIRSGRLSRPRPLPPPRIIDTLPVHIQQPIEVIHEFVPPLAPPQVIHGPPTIVEHVHISSQPSSVYEPIVELTPAHIHSEPLVQHHIQLPHSHIHTAPIVQHHVEVPHHHVHQLPLVHHHHSHHSPVVTTTHHVQPAVVHHPHHAHVHQPAVVAHHPHVHQPAVVAHHVHQPPAVSHHVHQVNQQVPVQQPAQQTPQLEPQIESEVQFIRPQNPPQQEQQPQPPQEGPNTPPMTPMIPQPY